MTPIKKQYLTAAGDALGLLREKVVTRGWEADAALTGFTVGGLAAHLAAQITSGAAALETDFSGREVIGVLDHFERAAWLGGEIDNEYNTAIRQGGLQAAAAGPQAVVDEAAAALQVLGDRLPELSEDAVGGGAHWPYAVRFDDYLVTRIMEIVVHIDDLAVSVRVETPELDVDVVDSAVWLLARLAARRHGQAALVRALARSERAPADISAL